MGEDKLLTITEVAEQTGLPASTIRYYDQQFGEFLGIERGSGRKRLFDDQSLKRLEKAHHLLKEEGLSLKQVRQFLQTNVKAGAPGEEIHDLKQQIKNLEHQLHEVKLIQGKILNIIDDIISKKL